jgi:DNA-binding SARP family transcriptional activator/Tfp pilus assembly protein PilF
VIETEFWLLGPLVVRRGEVAVPVPRGKQRAVLAALLLNANQVVSVDELTETLWGADPPPSARVTIQNNVMRLRRALGDADGGRIVTQPRGYCIRVAADELDVTRCEVLLEGARAAAREGSWHVVADRARAALKLWRGGPLADVESDLLASQEVPRLEELRLHARETLIDADLHLGRHGEVIVELRQLVVSYPLRERLHAQLMLALYRDGRQAEALAAYSAARQILIDELGTEPGSELQEVHQRILTADPSLAGPGEAAVLSGAVVPRELPAGVRHFTGRARELAALAALLEASGGQAPGTVVISAIGGTAGVGKTALAVHWAHQVAERFPDGQLYVNLRGYDPDQPMPVADALAGFLRALGVPSHDIPAEVAERAARYRSLLAERRMLVVLDNAGSEEQVRPLLPGGQACAVVVTSRDALTGLVIRDGAQRLDLDLLPAAEAVDLLRALIGPRVDADPAAAAALAEQCSRLPLALRVVAELAMVRPGLRLDSLRGELADHQRRLELMDAGGDPRTGVRAVFSWSYRQLGADAAGTFRLVGLHPGADLDAYAAASLTGGPVGEVRGQLEVLVRAHLVRHTGPGRYGLHDLLRAYARTLAADQDGGQEQQAALTRLLDYYLGAAAAAMDVLFPAERHRRPPTGGPVACLPPMADAGSARAWLDGELATLVSVAAYAAGNDWPGHATGLAATVFRYLDEGGHYAEAVALHTHACQAARRAGDRGAEAEAEHNLSVVELRQGRYLQGADHLWRVLDLYREIGDVTGQARALNNLGIIAARQGHRQQAADYVGQALAMYRQVGDQPGEARAVHNLGTIDAQQGRYRQAADHLGQALLLFRQDGNSGGEIHALNDLGLVEVREARYVSADAHLSQALALSRKTGNVAGQARALTNLGDLDLREGRHQRGRGFHQQALALFQQIGDQSGQAEALNGLGEILRARGQPVPARARHTAALTLASEIGDQEQQARAHDGLACCHRVRGEYGRCRQHWRQALTLYTELGAPEADQVRAQLASLPGQGLTAGMAGGHAEQDGGGLRGRVMSVRNGGLPGVAGPGPADGQRGCVGQQVMGGGAGDGHRHDVTGAGRAGGTGRSKVHQAVVAGAAGHAVGGGVLAALALGHEHFHAVAGLLLVLRVGCLLDQGGEPFVALLHDGGGDLGVHGRCRGTGADGVAEGERSGEPGRPDQVEGVLEVLVGLAGEAHDDVGGDGGVRDAGPDPVQDGQVPVPAVGAAHRLEHGVRAGLQRHVQAGHDVRGLCHRVDDVVGEVLRVRRGKADALQTLDLAAAAKQFAERVPVAELGAVGVHVLAEQRDLQDAVGDQRADFGQDVAGAAIPLLAAQARHDAERAGVVAAHRDRYPGGVAGLAPGRQQRREGLQRLGELGLRLVPDPGPFQQRGQRTHVVGAVHHVNPRRALRDPGAFQLRQAAAHRDLHAIALLRQQMTEVPVQPVGGVLPDRAGIEHDDVGGLAIGRGPVARLVKQPGQALGVVRVHLAPVGANLVRPAACHSTRIGADDAARAPRSWRERPA